MISTPFIIECVFNVPVTKVWRSLTDKNEMKDWYFSQIKEFEPIVGFKFEFFNDGSKYVKEWRVTEVVDGKKLSHTWAYKGYTGISEVTFELFEEGNKTRLKLTHTGLESFPSDPHFARHNFESGWTQIIGNNLKNFLL